MARISRDLSTQKKNFVLSLFAVNPKLTIREVQEKLKVQFAGIKGGETMNPATVLELRKGPDASQGSPIVAAVPDDSTQTVIDPATPVALDSGTTTGSTETIVTPTTTIGDLVSSNYSAITDNDPTPPSPVVQVAAPKPEPTVTPVEGETFVVKTGYVQVTDANGTYIRKVETPVVPAEAQ